MAADSPLLTDVLRLAEIKGWAVEHIRPARTAKGWRTPVTGHPGRPDLILARQGVVLLLEIKAEKGYPTIDQLGWLRELGPNAALVRPQDWPWIQLRLNGLTTPTFPPSLTHHGRWHGALAAWAETKLPGRPNR